MHTVRGGKSYAAWLRPRPGGGYQGLPVNEDPQRTNPEPEQDPQRAAELQQGWEQEYAELYSIIQDNPRAVELLDRLVQSDPGNHAAMSGSSAPPGRPSVPTQDEPPPFRGVPRTGARDAPYRAMATDQRPRGLRAGRCDYGV